LRIGVVSVFSAGESGADPFKRKNLLSLFSVGIFLAVRTARLKFRAFFSSFF
jgi:hypothetical protein